MLPFTTVFTSIFFISYLILIVDAFTTDSMAFHPIILSIVPSVCEYYLRKKNKIKTNKQGNFVWVVVNGNKTNQIPIQITNFDKFKDSNAKGNFSVIIIQSNSGLFTLWVAFSCFFRNAKIGFLFFIEFWHAVEGWVRWLESNSVGQSRGTTTSFSQSI